MTGVVNGLDSLDDEFLAASVGAISVSDGERALESLGWWELLGVLEDAEARAGVFTFFRAQGRSLATSGALCGLLAQPYLDVVGGEPGSVLATVQRLSLRRGAIDVVIGEVVGRQLLLDRPGQGAFLVGSADVELRRIDLPGRHVLHEVVFETSNRQPSIDERLACEARTRSKFLGRIAAATEILGAAESATAIAVDYAGNRQQFGRPIGAFQAVRHLLAWACTDCAALEATLTQAVLMNEAAPAIYGKVVKALAGRNGRRACERSLQVLGGIGFTAEHDHHHFHSRVLTLDSLLGTSSDLTHDLGTQLRTGISDAGFATASLAADDLP